MKKDQLDRLQEILFHMKSFIRNGIALGFIKMPDTSVPDPAHNMPAEVDEAIKIVGDAIFESQKCLEPDVFDFIPPFKSEFSTPGQDAAALHRAAMNILSFIECSHRPPVRDRLEGGRMVSVRLHALADLQDAVDNYVPAAIINPDDAVDANRFRILESYIEPTRPYIAFDENQYWKSSSVKIPSGEVCIDENISLSKLADILLEQRVSSQRLATISYGICKEAILANAEIVSKGRVVEDSHEDKKQ